MSEAEEFKKRNVETLYDKNGLIREAISSAKIDRYGDLRAKEERLSWLESIGFKREWKSVFDIFFNKPDFFLTFQSTWDFKEKQIRKETAREIFSEIEECYQHILNMNKCSCVECRAYRRLKKKYGVE